jgi:hypothetical protein
MSKLPSDLSTVTTVAVDLAKHIFQVHGCDAAGKVVCSATIKVRMRIASPEMLPSIVVLPHLKWSQRWLGGKDEEGQYGDAERIG